MSEDLAKLAADALADEKRGTPGPWSTSETEADIGARGGFWFVNEDSAKCATVAEVGYGKAHGVDAVIIATARTREPLLARGYLEAVAHFTSEHTALIEAIEHGDRMRKDRDAALAECAALRGKLAEAETDIHEMRRVATRWAEEYAALFNDAEQLRAEVSRLSVELALGKGDR